MTLLATPSCDDRVQFRMTATLTMAERIPFPPPLDAVNNRTLCKTDPPGQGPKIMTRNQTQKTKKRTKSLRIREVVDSASQGCKPAVHTNDQRTFLVASVRLSLARDGGEGGGGSDAPSPISGFATGFELFWFDFIVETNGFTSVVACVRFLFFACRRHWW